MQRAGQCPACNHLFNPTDHAPMVSVVCGHSLCKHCATQSTPPGNDSDTDSTSSDDPVLDDTSSACPICHKQFEGFVTNFEALAVLQSTSQQHTTTHSSNATIAPSHSNAPDLTTVVTEDLVIDRRLIRFVRASPYELGSGLSAIVYKGLYQNRPVAVKSIRTMSDSFATEDRLRRELRNASRLRNPHIVEFIGASWDFEDGPKSPRSVLLVTELMSGGNLRENLNSLNNGNGLAVESFVHIALQIARGIEYLHAEGLAHRDIKSANVLLTQALPDNSNRFPANTRAKIADFGLSKYIDKATGGGTVMQSIMEPGRLEATYAYLAPEAFGGDKSNVARRSHCADDDDVRYDNMAKKRDIYALGVLFWEMLTGAVPWAHVPLPDVYVRVCVRSDRPSPAVDDKAVDRTFHRLIDRCWAQNPSRRPSARSIVAKLEKLALKYPLVDGSTAATDSAPAVSLQSSNNAPVDSNTPSYPAVSDHHKESRSIRGAHLLPQSLPSQKVQQLSTLPVNHIDHNEYSGAQNIGAKSGHRGHGGIGEKISAKCEYPSDNNFSAMNGKSGTSRSSPLDISSLSSNPGTNHVVGHHPHSQFQASDSHEIPSAASRKSMRVKRSDSETSDGNAARLASHGVLSSHHSNVPQPGATAVSTNSGVSGTQNKTSATAVAATAAAIAAAKDRERKRDDLRVARGAAVTTAAARVALGTAVAGGNTGHAGIGSAGNDVNGFPLVGATDSRGRSVKKEKSERAVVYADSDEEAQDFDPDRAAAEEAFAESNGALLESSKGVRSTLPGGQSSHQSQQQPLVSRVTGRPRSPVVRRPLSPPKGQSFTPTDAQDRQVAEECLGASQSLLKSAGPSNGSSVGKLTTSASRGRLDRTLSGSGGNVAKVAVDGSSGFVGSGNAFGVSGSNTGGVIGNASGTTKGAHVSVAPLRINGQARTPGLGSMAASPAISAEETSRKAAAGRMSRNGSGKHLIKSPSTTGVEHRRENGFGIVKSGSASGFGMHRRPPSAKSRSLHMSKSGSGDNGLTRDTDVTNRNGVGVGSGKSSIAVGTVRNNPLNGGGSMRENYLSLVDSMDKTQLLEALSQRMPPLRLAAISLAGLLSSKHRDDEDVLRNCCLRLHRLTVPQGTSSSQSTASGYQHSGYQGDYQAGRHTSGGNGVTEKEQGSIRKYLKSRQGVEALLQALHPPQVRHPTTLCYGLLALGNLTAWDLEAHRQFRNSHGVVQVVHVMKSHSENEGVQEKGCYALACVGAAYPPKSKAIFEESGGLDVVIRALSRVAGQECNEAVIKQACAALGAMCSSCPSNALYAGRKGGLRYLVLSFERFRKASREESGGKRSEMRVACKSFVDLLCETENRREGGAKGGCTMMIRAIRIFRLDSEFIEKGLATLTQFCVVPSNGKLIVDANGIADVVAAMDRFKLAEGILKEGCRLLTALIGVMGDQARQKVVKVDGAEIIMFGLGRFGGVSETNEEAVIEGCYSLKALFHMIDVAEGEALGRRMRKNRCDKVLKGVMSAHQTDSDVLKAAQDALKQLSRLSGNGGLWGWVRNGSRRW